MNLWEIVPYVSFGPLQFGISRSSARGLLGADFRAYKKSRTSVTETDGYHSLGVHLYYDANDLLKFVEAFMPCVPTYQNVSILPGENPQQVLENLASIGQSPRIILDGFGFDDLGAAFFAGDDKRIESSLVFRRDEYEKTLEKWQQLAEKQRLREERRKSKGPIHNPFQ